MNAEIWFLAICQDCTPVLPQPFTNKAECAGWAVVHHGATGHEVTLVQERRRAPLVNADCGYGVVPGRGDHEYGPPMVYPGEGCER